MAGKPKLMQAKKSLGQNFLINDTIIQKIVSLFVCDENDLIMEIGPGKGALTKYLAKLPGKVVCIEIDKDMERYLNYPDVEVIYDDILNIDLAKLVQNYNYRNLYIIGNLPYYITSPIIEKILKAGLNASKMVFMVQKEVAQRFSSRPGHREYGYMTIFINHYCEVKKEFLVPKNNFKPVPKVDSAIISLTLKNHPNLPEEFWQFLKECFSHKRKTLKNNLAKYDKTVVDEVLHSHNLDLAVRAEELDEEIFIELYEKCKGK